MCLTFSHKNLNPYKDEVPRRKLPIGGCVYLCAPVWAIFIQPVWDWMFMVNHSVMDQRSTERKERESVKQLLQEALELAEQQGSTNVAEKIKKVMSAHYSYRNPSR